MYILLAGGVLNTVLVPQIVRAIRGDADRGEAYTNRIMTAGLIALGLITLLLTLAVPAIMSLYSAGGWKSPALSAQYAVDDHARLLLHAAGLLLRRARAWPGRCSTPATGSGR